MFKIIRDGKEIELTAVELMDAHSAYEKNSIIEDIKSTFENESLPVLSDDNLPALAEKALRFLSKNDPYFEAFWESIRDAIESELAVLVGVEYDRLVTMTIKTKDNISFKYKNDDGEECEFIGTAKELYEDWLNGADRCPSNDTRVYAIKIADESFEVLNFVELINVLSKIFYESSDDSEDESIGVNLMINGQPTTITLHLYSQVDFMGEERAGIALAVQESDGDYMLTVSLGEFIGMKNAAYIDTNNCGTEMIDALVEDGFAINTGFTKRSGFCVYPLYIFNEDFLKTAGSEEYAKYEESYKEATGEA